MKRQELEHIVRVAAAITGETEFIIIGSQSILGKFPDAPRSLRQSMEADIYPKARPELAELISGSIRTFTAPSTTTPMAWPQKTAWLGSINRMSGPRFAVKRYGVHGTSF